MTNLKVIVVSVVVALLISLGVGFYFVGSVQSNLVAGGLSERDVQAVSLKVGSGGTKLVAVQKGVCGLLISGASQTSSTTKQYDCAVTGVRSGDTIIFGSATTTTLTTDLTRWVFAGARASTTNGFISFVVQNQTGADRVISAAAASNTPYLILR